MSAAQWSVIAVYALLLLAMVTELRKDLRLLWVEPWAVWLVGAICAALLTAAAWLFFLIASKP